MESWRVKARRFWMDERGVSAVEYGLLLSLIGAAIAATMLALGQGISDRMDTAGTDITSGGSSS